MDQPAGIAIVADDHELMREALGSILTGRLGFASAILVSSFDEALERLVGTAGVTLALFDLHMPGVENAATIGAVRRFFPAVKVAIVSGSSQRRDILMALEAGVHGYIPKAMSIDAIAAALKSVLDGSVYVPATLPEGSGAKASGGKDSKRSPEEEAPRLTARQRDVLELIVDGRSNKEIARALDLSEGTVKIHVAAIFQSLKVPNRAAAAVVGARLLGDGAQPP
jgi:DNA-binding NarL/FixJ family response regulator